MNGASSANIPYKNELRDRQGCGECWWERTITARIRDGSTIPVVLDHVYWNWITGTPMHIHLDGIQRIRVIEDKHHQREENN